MFLSFIIPVYNTEEYLDECLQSLLNQDIPAEEYEIVCVNDGSTDGSPEILRRYEREYGNVTVIDQENGGVCRARNAGLQAARGEYIWYIDADDLIRENCLAMLWQVVKSKSPDRLVIDHFEYIPEAEDADNMRTNTSWKDSVVWRSLFRREYLLSHDLWFHYPELTFGEDALYMYEVRRGDPQNLELADPVYYHRVRPGSLSTELSPRTEAKRLLCNIREAEILKDYYEKKDGILTEETANRFMSFLWGSLFRILRMPGKEAKPYMKLLREKGLYPYPTPRECTLSKCPEINRNDLPGRIMDKLYTNLGSRWGYYGMKALYFLLQAKHKIMK